VGGVINLGYLLRNCGYNSGEKKSGVDWTKERVLK
jgi:hypothetical protein